MCAGIGERRRDIGERWWLVWGAQGSTWPEAERDHPDVVRRWRSEFDFRLPGGGERCICALFVSVSVCVRASVRLCCWVTNFVYHMCR